MNWNQKVGQIFHVHPRTNAPGNLWIERREAIKRLHEAMNRPGGHVCLDGPSGAGKTSLAWTYVAANRVSHVQVKITRSMTWISFCMQLIDADDNSELSVSGDLEAGINNALPTLKFRISLGQKSRSSDHLEHKRKLAEQLDEFEIAKRLIKSNAILLIDDIEQANNELLIRITDLCKVLTQYSHSTNAKLMLIGTGSIYQQLSMSNPALDERLLQVSLGGFSEKTRALSLITRGLNLLKVEHPWSHNVKPSVQASAPECERLIWEAADGLPKSLNSLGHSIALCAPGGQANVTDIVREAESMKEQNWKSYAQRFPQVIDHLYHNPLALRVVYRLYRDGISDVHQVFKIKSEVTKENHGATDRSVDEAIDQLAALDFLVRTGKSGELLFVQHPAAAHTLGVAVRDAQRFRALVEIHADKDSSQIRLGFPIQERIVPSSTPDEHNMG